jgi:hypothetical protein
MQEGIPCLRNQPFFYTGISLSLMVAVYLAVKSFDTFREEWHQFNGRVK